MRNCKHVGGDKFEAKVQFLICRRKHLRESKYFDCCCQRCSDPTENGTHFSTLLCSLCKDTEGRVTSTDPLNFEADWKCNGCGNKTPGGQIEELVEVLEREVSQLPTTKVTANGGILHPYLKGCPNLTFGYLLCKCRAHITISKGSQIYFYCNNFSEFQN